jgi:hypothetical protein
MRHSGFVLACLCSLCLATDLSAAPIDVRFDGSITNVDILSSVLSVGQPVVIDLSWDTNAPNLCPRGSRSGLYRMNSASLAVGGLGFRSSQAAIESDGPLGNCLPGPDLYGAQTRSASRRPLVLMYEPAETVATFHSQRLRGGPVLDRQSAIGWREFQAAVRATAVVMINKHGQRALEMPGVHNQQPVKTFGPDGSDEPFRDPIGLRNLNRTLRARHFTKRERPLFYAIELTYPTRLGAPSALSRIAGRSGAVSTAVALINRPPDRTASLTCMNG